jgi:hypothetical protein
MLGAAYSTAVDRKIAANLPGLCARLRLQDVAQLMGDFLRADETTQRLHKMGSSAVKPRGIEAFRALVQKSGWSVERVAERPFSDHFLLT